MPLDDRPIERHLDRYLLTTDRSRIPVDTVLTLLAREHWAAQIRPGSFQRAMDNSVCFGVLDADRLIGFGRAVSDLATYAYWTDVVVDPEYRRQGIGHSLVEQMLAHPDLQGLRRVALFTRDSRRLYERFGFSTEISPDRIYMEIRPGPGWL